MTDNSEVISVTELISLISRLETALKQFPDDEKAPERKEALRQFRLAAREILEF